jgi:hypothetical protein
MTKDDLYAISYKWFEGLRKQEKSGVHDPKFHARYKDDDVAEDDDSWAALDIPFAKEVRAWIKGMGPFPGAPADPQSKVESPKLGELFLGTRRVMVM